MQFRKDINGLRAFAVVAVLLFHFSPELVPGGFAGVDVFFVISGYLMTGIIFKGLQNGSFSVLKFYVARASRIIPALAVLCIAVLIFGWFFLTPIEYRTLGLHAFSSIGFFSNITYWTESGYFDSSAHEKWLLHTWSLSVEWQFYIIYPLVLVAMKRFMSLSAMKLSIVLATVAAFIFCAVATYKNPSASYYLLPTRAWEMLVGGVAFLYPWNVPVNKKRVLEVIGIAFIVASYFFISGDNFWPGYLAMIPVLGTFLIIQAQRDDSAITGNIICQKLGQWSYSIYLWHWPLVVAIFYFSLSISFIFLFIALSIFLGFLSNRYIEQIKFKGNFDNWVKLFRFKPVLVACLAGLFGFSVFASDGVLIRKDSEYQKKVKGVIEAVGDRFYPDPNKKIAGSDVRFIKGNSDKNILFIGASHIEHTFPYAKEHGGDYNVYYVTKGGCFLTPSYQRPQVSCENIQNYENLIGEVEFSKIVTSFYLFGKFLPEDEASRSAEINQRIQEYDEFLKFAKSRADEVFLILGEPIGDEFDPKRSLRHNLKPYITIEQAREKFRLHESAMSRLTELDGIEILDPIDYLCDEVCKVMDEDYKFYYEDKTHFRPWYVINHATYLGEVFQ